MNIGREWLIALLMTLAPLATSQTVSYVHTDALGSIVAVTDQSRDVIERREYEPFGMQLTPAVDDGPGFTGHVQDDATGLTYMQQRYYDPAIGRFLSVDPVGALSNPINHFARYHYANNNPYKYTDPDGRKVVANSRAEGSRVSGWINERAQGTYEFDADRNLVKTSEGEPSSTRSSSYSKELDTAIASDKVVTIHIRQTVADSTSGAEVDIDTYAKGGITGRDGDGIHVALTGNDSVVTAQGGSSYVATPADILMHEITAHVLPAIGYPNTGNGIENENKLRGEIDGLPLRQVLPHPEQ